MAPRRSSKLPLAAFAGAARVAAAAAGASASTPPALSWRRRSVPASSWDGDGDGAISAPELLAAADLLGLGLGAARGLGASSPGPGGVNLVPRAEVGPDAAYVNCPCIDHVADASWAALVAPYVPPGRRSELRAADGAVFPRSYGSAACRAWDEGTGFMGLCDRATPPRFCQQKWCFVDEKNCGRTDVKSSRSLPGLSYSYETCGNIGAYSHMFNVTSFLPLHLPYINIQEDRRASHGKRLVIISKSPSTPIKALKALLMMGAAVLDVLNVPLTSVRYRDISSPSIREDGLSMYTDCVSDIALGNMDMCMGDWWFTLERINLGVPFVPVYHEDIRLLLRKGQRRAKGLQQYRYRMNLLTSAIKPFDYKLWACIVVGMFSASLVMAVMERAKQEKRVVFGEAVYLASSSFVSFSSAYSPKTPGGKVMGFGVSFFLTIVGASFTANTAQFFVQEAAHDRYHSLRDVLDDGKPICISGGIALKKILVSRYGERLAELGEVKPESELFTLPPSECFGWIAQTNIVIDAWSTYRTDACEYEFVGETLFQFFLGYYVCSELFHPTMYAVSKLRYNGTWSSIHGQVWPKSTGCNSKTRTGPMQLTADHMFGPNAGLLICCLVSLSLHVFSQTARKVRGISALTELEDSSSADAHGD
ncbi:unnamed protein product [Prorocentrum cordatum]|uniref:Ionotropic glutamate receptor C-terminal domain-containing protein n=1 Tax=Prorocentrum cordatum TaxID=2364126 RepID=A0ABN9V6X2_9DINO|nr:unnamed protein product [Polarella glacialis]